MELAEFDAHRALARTASGEISYGDIGSGRTAVFLHGLGTNAFFWRNLVDELRTTARCIAIDLPGHGASPVSAGRDHTLSGLADSIEDFCAALGLDNIDLVANDTGGAIAQIFAARHPERLATLTLTNCEAHDNLPNEVFRPTVERAKRGEMAQFAGQLLANLDIVRSPASLGGSYEDSAYLTDELIRAYFGPVAGTPEAARHFERLLSTMQPTNLLEVEPQLRRLTVPTFIVWGTADRHFEVSWAYWLRDTIPGAYEVVELEGAKLHFPDERFRQFAPLLRRHWDAHPPRSTGPGSDPDGSAAEVVATDAQS